MVFVDEFAAGDLGFLFVGAAVHVDLGAGAAGACVAHFPEIVVFVAVEDMVLRQMSLPDGGSFVVAGQTFVSRAFEDSGVEVFRVEFQYVHQVFPCPVDGLLLEVVAEGPVAEHLEHGVVVGVVSDFLQVVVFAADAETFLAVRHARIFDRVVAQDDALPRVHAGVGEHQRRVIFYHHWRAGDHLVAFACHEVQKGLANLLTCHYLALFLVQYGWFCCLPFKAS